MFACLNCDEVFDPATTNWMCPRCRHKWSCCEGAALPDNSCLGG